MASQISRLLEPLSQNFKINTLAHVTIFDNKLLLISSNTGWVESYVSNDIYNSDHYQDEISQMEQRDTFVIFRGDNKSKLTDTMHNNHMWHELSIYKRYSTHIEMWNFTTCKDNEQIVNFYINNITLFERFIVYFKNQASNVLDYTDNDKLLTRSNKIVLDNNNLHTRTKNHDFIANTTLDYINTSAGKTHISSREVECLYLLSKGHTVKEIAQILDISPRTVDTYIERLKQKLQCNFKSELIQKFKSDLSKYYEAELCNRE